MKKVLVINASARMLNSHSRTLTAVFIENWKKQHHDAEISYRELGNGNVTHIDEVWIAANIKPAADRTAKEMEVLSTSDEYIAELRNADVIVLGTPMYNWSIPSVLKAYIDHIMRLNETFKVDPGNAQQPYIGLLENKTLVLLVARGIAGYETGENNSHMNFQTTYLRTVFNMLGIHDIQLIAVDGTSLDKEQLKLSIEKAHRNVQQLIAQQLN